MVQLAVKDPGPEGGKEDSGVNLIKSLKLVLGWNKKCWCSYFYEIQMPAGEPLNKIKNASMKRNF